MDSRRLSKHPLHLGRGATAVAQPEFKADMDWYNAYGQRHGDDGAEGRLVSMHTFTQPWDTWEMHPNGAEVVLVTAGSLTMHQEYPDGTSKIIELQEGEYLVNLPGVWHTADADASVTALFITAGEGTEIRAR